MRIEQYLKGPRKDSPVQAVGDHPLLSPVPAGVQYFYDGGEDTKPDGARANAEAAEAAKWVVEAAAAAPHHPEVKAAGRRLLQCLNFTGNLELFLVYSDDGKHTLLGYVWDRILQLGLDQKLDALGDQSRRRQALHSRTP